MENKAVSNTGPIIHLSEINLINAFNIFREILTPDEVVSELRKNKINIPKSIKVKSLKGEWKDLVKILTNQKDLDLGESCAISLSLQEKVNYFLTDDLDARIVAKEYLLEVHGTIGIILRAYREKLIDKKTAIEKVTELKTKSSLFITQDLIDNIISSINSFRH
jgi:predicted nucleic acid-binding protein